MIKNREIIRIFAAKYCKRLIMEQELRTSLSGRLRNTSLPKTSVLFPMFEAIVNSIHSIDERQESDKRYTLDTSQIDISILREQVLQLEEGSKGRICGFEIKDNGIGFNDRNYSSFITLDSEYKADKGCKGIGRLVWLKAFNSVRINSVYLDGLKRFRRTFIFSINGISNHEIEEIANDTPIETIITLNGIKKEYLDYLPKTVDAIGRRVVDHCIWYFLRAGGAPNICILDETDTLNLNKDFEYGKSKEMFQESIDIKGQRFDLTHIKMPVGVSSANKLYYGAANRLVLEESLTGRIPGLYSELEDGKQKFSYVCFVAADYLTDNVSPQRLEFEIPDKNDGIFAETDICMEDIRNSVIGTVSSYLSSYLQKNIAKSEERLQNFISKQQPRYRSILSRLTEEDKAFNPNITDKALELRLHSRLMAVEAELLSEGHDLLNDNDISEEEYNNKLNAYLNKAGDLKQSDLASYVARRRVVIDLLEKALGVADNGKYVKEDVIHRLIMPMRKTSDDIIEDDSNLWLIDERLAFHSFLASDKTLLSMPITGDQSTKEPDLCALNVYDNPILINDTQKPPLASITIVEFKRPMRNNAKLGEDDDPIEQALSYLDRIRIGEVTTPQGRPITASENIPGFCYIICDITPTIKKRCKMKDLKETYDKLGYFGYSSSYNAYIEVISFDKLVQAAKERNRVFFDKLGIPSGL